MVSLSSPLFVFFFSFFFFWVLLRLVIFSCYFFTMGFSDWAFVYVMIHYMSQMKSLINGKNTNNIVKLTDGTLY